VADQVAPGVGHVRVLEPEDERHLAADLAEEVDGVVAVLGRGRGRVGRGVGAQGAAVDVGGEEAGGG
jgi:hypothetical protein